MTPLITFTRTNIHAYEQFIVKVTKVQCQGEKNNETSLRLFNVSTQTNEINEYWFV